jgi:hypothetical protein
LFGDTYLDGNAIFHGLHVADHADLTALALEALQGINRDLEAVGVK